MAFAWLNSSSDADARPAYNRSFYLYGTFNIMDSAGVYLPNLTLPQRVAAGAPVNMSVVGCNLYSNDSFIHVNTTTRLAVREELANMSTSAHWDSYEPLAAVNAEELDILDLVRTACFVACYSGGTDVDGAVDDSHIQAVRDKLQFGQIGRAQARFHGKVSARALLLSHELKLKYP